jgi:tetratricopeptide (TPR) repeat protein
MYSRPAEAETASRLLIQLAIQHGEPGWEAEAQYDLGRALALQGHLSEAEACFRRSIALYTGPAQDGYEEARVQHTLAELLLAQGRLTEAEPTLRRAIEGLAAARDWQAETLALFKLTALLFDLGRPDEAVQTLRRSYPLTRLTGDPQPAEAKILVRVARGLMDTKMLRDAEWALRRCLTRATAVRNLECYLEALSMLTGLLSETGRTDEAEQVYRDALALAAELNSAHLELMVHVEMAEWSASYGRSDDARAVLRRCVDNARSTSRGDLEALCLLTRSATTSSPRAALLFSRRAYALAKLAERDRLMAEALVSVARARERLGHPRRAERALRRAIPLAEAAEAAEVEAEALTLLAGILEARGETEEAAALRE